MTERRRLREEAIANLAAASVESPVPRRASEGLSVEQIKGELRQQQVDRYQSMLDRLNLHILREEIPDDVYQEYRGRLRTLALSELGPERTPAIFDHERPSANFLRAVVYRIEQQLGQEITCLDRHDHYQALDGRVYGRVRFDKMAWLPIVGNEVVRRVSSEDGETDFLIDWIGRAYFVNDELAATGYVRKEGAEDEAGEQRTLPIWQGKVIEKIQESEIYEGRVTDANEVGWSGWVKFDRTGLKIPVHNGQLHAAYRGRGIYGVEQVHDHQGKMSGLVAVGHDEDSGVAALNVMIDGQLLETLEGYDHYYPSVPEWVTFQVFDGEEVWSGSIAGWTVDQSGFRRRHNVAVIAGELVHEIDGVKISGARDILIDDQGRPSGLVEYRSMKTGNDYWVPLVKGKVLQEIEGQMVTGAKFEELQDDQWTGQVRLHGMEMQPVWRGRLVRSWHGSPLEEGYGDNQLFEIDGTVNGQVYILKGEDVVEEKLVLASLPPELRDQVGGV